MSEFNKNNFFNEVKKRMDATLSSLTNHEFKGLRAGRASPNFLDPVNVEAYGSRMPLAQLATVTAQDNIINVQVWDKSMVKAVEKAVSITLENVTVSSSGQDVRVCLPPLSEERRKELVKLAGKYAEQAKVSLRNIRREMLDILKKEEKVLSKDDVHAISEKVQEITNDYSKKVDVMLASKEKDILDS